MKHSNNSPPAPERAELERQLESLQRDIRQLQLERDLLKKANEILKKGLGVDLQLLTNREKTLLVDALKALYALPELLAQLDLARSSYFYHRARVKAADKYFTVRKTLTDIFELNHRCYGYRRLQASLTRQCVTISEKVVQRLMKQERLVVAKPKRRRYGSYLGEISPAAENLINRDFRASAPNEKWLTDITEFQIPAGKVYRNSLRGDVSTGAAESRAIVRRQIQIELEESNLGSFEVQATSLLNNLESIAGRMASNQAARRALPKAAYSEDDLARVRLFEKNFRGNASSFGYESAEIKDIRISTDTLTPILSDLELREIISKPKASLVADSSASDFVRLIWSYLLALYQTSSTRGFEGNHPGVLLMDEPGQHSMRAISQHALLQLLSGAGKLQSIVAASFDENESVFLEATAGLKFKLINWDGKVIQQLQ